MLPGYSVPLNTAAQARVDPPWQTWTVVSKYGRFARRRQRPLTQAQVEASMCHLRGLVMLKLNRSDQAKQCFLEALALDVKCYDSFEQLINGEMMSVDEGNQLFI